MRQELTRPVYFDNETLWMRVVAPTIKETANHIKQIEELLNSRVPRNDAFVTLGDKKYPGYCFNKDGEQIVVTDGFTLFVYTDGEQDIMPHTYFVRG